jgi:fumarate hydratase class II
MLIASYESLECGLNSLRELALGGTAVGTGINAPKNFDQLIDKEISSFTKFKFIPMKNKFRGLASKDQVVLVHSILKTLATSIYKVANDIR